MKIGFFINDIDTENPFYGTQRLAMEATGRGHDVFYLDVDAFIYDSDEELRASARRAQASTDPEEFMEAIRDEDSTERISVEGLDVLMLRNNPADDYESRPWAQTVGVTFGNVAAERGVLVMNAPTGLAKATNKLYFQTFPAHVRPRTKITREPDEARSFVEEQGGEAVLKPLAGSGGHGVFLVTPDGANLNQMIETTMRDGYIVVQEYLPAAVEGDIRLFALDGEALQVDGNYAAVRRLGSGDDVRSNMRGAETPGDSDFTTEPAEITDEILGIVDAIGDKLHRDGIFLAGLDIAGDKLMEINVFSPGGLWSIEKHTGTDFTPAIIDALEERLRS